jgi:hypothetical protein
MTAKPTALPDDEYNAYMSLARTETELAQIATLVADFAPAHRELLLHRVNAVRAVLDRIETELNTAHL